MRTGYDDLVSIVFFWWKQGQFSTYVVFHFIYCLVNISIYKSITKEVVCIYSAKKFGCSVYNLCYILLFLIWELALLLFLVCSLVFFYFSYYFEIKLPSYKKLRGPVDPAWKQNLD